MLAYECLLLFSLLLWARQILKRHEYFGQYGKVVKVVAHRNHVPATDSRPASAAAYITFENTESARAAIQVPRPSCYPLLPPSARSVVPRWLLALSALIRCAIAEGFARLFVVLPL
jgi:hypothetical protein